jgi:hypothetical protein
MSNSMKLRGFTIMMTNKNENVNENTLTETILTSILNFFNYTCHKSDIKPFNSDSGRNEYLKIVEIIKKHNNFDFNNDENKKIITDLVKVLKINLYVYNIYSIDEKQINAKGISDENMTEFNKDGKVKIRCS